MHGTRTIPGVRKIDGGHSELLSRQRQLGGWRHREESERGWFMHGHAKVVAVGFGSGSREDGFMGVATWCSKGNSVVSG